MSRGLSAEADMAAIVVQCFLIERDTIGSILSEMPIVEASIGDWEASEEEVEDTGIQYGQSLC